ncbi:MAG: TldD/PmbA family protein [Phycisphaerales bacterium]|nr:TldD/PmbA family protein [Phycisphaerales bacterium]
MKPKRHHRKKLLLLPGLLCSLISSPASAGSEHPLLKVMEDEMKLSMEKLVSPEGTKPYFIQYTIADTRSISISATLGAITSNQENERRMLGVDVRCGDYSLDNTHQIRGGGFGGFRYWGGWTSLPLDHNPVATRHAIWLKTDEAFKSAVKLLAQVKANVKVKVEEEDQSDDFSKEEPNQKIGAWQDFSGDRAFFAEKMRKYSRLFRSHPLIYNSGVSLSGQVTNKLAVNTEKSRIQSGQGWWRIGIQASTIADDGMELWQYKSFDSHTAGGLPDDATVLKAVEQLIEEVLALRAAPVVEPYTGPAILMNRAAGVFFHEIFGHRIEGHRQKDVEEGQTFAKKIGKEVLPEFLSVVDNPSLREFKDIELNGFYEFDDECVRGQPVRLVEKGILKTFLLSRSPTRGFTKSNGHGRCQVGMKPVARQGNLIVQSKNKVSYEELRSRLIEECNKQGKEYGLRFEDISGGFTNTQRWSPQAFKVLPILVYKVYVDGRPDELVRGVDLVGTPLTCFTQILCTADDEDVFNGICGAESGSVPVSAIAPSILVQQIEVEKKRKAQDRPPILDAPIASEKKAG